MSRTLFLRIWGTLEEPRGLTAVYVVAYLVAVAAAVGAMVTPTPHPLPYTDTGLRVMVVVFLGVSGLVGAPAAWAGAWWLERAAAMGALGGAGVMLFEASVAWLYPGGPVLMAPALTVPASVFSVLLFLVRLIRVTQQPYAPGKGPDLPEVAAERLLSHMVQEEQERKGQGGRQVG